MHRYHACIAQSAITPSVSSEMFATQVDEEHVLIFSTCSWGGQNGANFQPVIETPRYLPSRGCPPISRFLFPVISQGLNMKAKQKEPVLEGPAKHEDCLQEDDTMKRRA